MQCERITFMGKLRFFYQRMCQLTEQVGTRQYCRQEEMTVTEITIPGA